MGSVQQTGGLVSEIKKIGVLGAGVMGSGIAQVTSTAGYDTVCYDVDAGALDRGREHVTTGRYGLDRGVERGKLTREQADTALARLSFTGSFADAAAADLVIEAVPERLELKIRVLRDLDRAAPEPTILASNTSGFPIAALAAATDRAHRVIGWHWASPAPVMRLAEIVSTRETSGETVVAVRDVATACGKNPIVIKDTPMAWGFVTNRVYFAMVAEAQKAVSEGIATADDVDQLMMDCFRWPTGPFGMVKGAGSGWADASHG
jgi:3-hydroxybutyryl-CoA dehydrogenase